MLIGVNEYKTDQFMDLRGAVNDVETMREVLTSRFGFSQENIVVLTDAEATRAAILKALERLAEQARPEDLVYIHYSGHGSQVRDMNGDEADDNRDETILPHDARTEGVPDITDDELGAILASLRAETAVIVLDSCHSGTATRGGIATRSVPPDTRTELYERPQSEIAKRSIVQLDKPERYILLTGAASNQSALDGPLEGEYRGFFSYALAKCLGAADPGISPRELHQRVKQTFERLSEEFGGLQLPEPQFEAAAAVLEQPLFRSAGSAEDSRPSTAGSSRPYLTVIPEEPGQVRLARGLTLNAAIGSYWAIYPPEETEFPPGGALARARVIRTDGTDSIAEVEPSGLSLGTGHRAVALAYAPSTARVKVRWDDVDPALQARLEAQVRRRFPDVEFVAADEFARFVVEVRKGACRVFDAAGLTLVEEFPAASDDETGERLASLFSRSLNASSLLALANPMSELRLELKVVGFDDTAELRIKKPGEPRSSRNSLMLEIVSNTDCYLTIVDVDTEGGVNVLFPNSYSKPDFYPQGFIQRARNVRIPDSLVGGNRAGFFWDYQPPAGMDTIVAFASTDLETAETIRKWVTSVPGMTARGVGEPASVSRIRGHERLECLRDDLARRAGIRGIGVVADDAAPAAGGAAGEEMSQVTATPTNPDWNSAALRVRISD